MHVVVFWTQIIKYIQTLLVLADKSVQIIKNVKNIMTDTTSRLMNTLMYNKQF